ncbi:MAG: HD domain-containing protein [Gammaproteobacteria bacterium]|nr:HD domain-containing protein [Gammaproteobacteria bacterium]
MTPFEKKLLTLRQQLIGARYYNALTALDFAMAYHTGTRKDGVTPEFQHQVEIALYALTLADVKYREEVIATIMLHDVREDYSITDYEIAHLFDSNEFTLRVNQAVENMTKEWRGIKKDEAQLFEAMAIDPIASIAKGCDRIHNLGSMVGVFKIEKQKAYLEEVDRLFIPMLKTARKKFAYQHNAYMNILHMMRSQCDLIRAIHEAT